MKSTALFSAALIVLMTCGARASLLNDLVGIWNVRTTFEYNGREIMVPSKTTVKRLPGGVIYYFSEEKVNRHWVVVSKLWMLPGGNLLGIGYNDNGGTAAIGEGTWRASGNVLTVSITAETLRGKSSTSASATRVNRNTWRQSATVTDRDGTQNYIDSYTRAR